MSFFKASLSLTDKFILGFLAVVCFTGFSASIAGRYLINKMVLEETRQRVYSDLNASWGIYNQLLNNVGTKIQLTASRFFLRDNFPDGDLDEIRAELARVQEKEGFDILLITDSQGVVRYRAHCPQAFGDDISQLPIVRTALQMSPTQSTFILASPDLEKEGTLVTSRSSIIRNSSEASESEHIANQAERAVLIVGASAPIIADDTSLLGVLFGGIILNNNRVVVDQIKSVVFKEETGPVTALEVVTLFQKGVRIATTLPGPNGHRAIGTTLTEEASVHLIKEGKTFLKRVLIVDDWYITAYRPILDMGGKPVGALGVGVLEEKYQVMKEEVVMVFLSLTLLAMILALVISLLLARNITQPVSVLAKKAKMIGSGNFVEIDPPSRDEIGHFAETFNKMSRSLKEREHRLQAQTEELLQTKEELEKANRALLEQSKRLKRSVKELTVLFEASKKISSSLSLSEILDSIMGVLMEKFQTDTWSIRLLDDDGYLRIKSQRGLSPEFIAAADRKPTMDSYSGECFLTNRIIIVEDASKADKPISTNLEVHEGIKSFGLVPITIENEALGVLAGASKEYKGFFTKDYSEFMRTLAQQLAVAIRNARLYEKVKSFSEELEKEVAKRTKELQEKSQLLAQSEKLAALGEMADRVAHETRNPIVTIGGFSRRIRRTLADDDPMVKYIDIIINEVERLEKMIFWITEYKKYISAEFEAANIHTVLEHAIGALADKIKDHNVTIERNFLPDLPLVRVDKKNMEFVFTNLLENGIESIDNQGVLHLATRLKGNNLLEVIISDSGKGIASDDLKRIYYPFFTSMISGSGMGLTITHKIIKDHNGSLKVKSTPGKGTTFTVELPIMHKTDDLASHAS